MLDVGAGLASKYGDKFEHGILSIVPVDPLASFYNLINEKYAKNEVKNCKFGLFEFLACSYEKDTVSGIIINNALDHCIDPYKSFVECLYIIKPGGVLHLSHRRAEALFENWFGLHKWNIDYNKDDDLIFWNNDNYINVTGKFKSIANFDMHHSNYDGTVDREYDFVTVDVTKKEGFSLENFFPTDEEQKKLSALLGYLMEEFARIYFKYIGNP